MIKRTVKRLLEGKAGEWREERKTPINVDE
jgi:hypothetical protein